MGRRCEIAWAAGLFEGEGCISIGAQPHHLRLTVRMTDRDVVERFAAIVGEGHIYETERRPPRKMIWTWQSTGRAAASALLLVLPYLGERRGHRAQEALHAFHDHVLGVTHVRACEACGEEFQPAYSARSLEQRFCRPECRETSRVAV